MWNLIHFSFPTLAWSDLRAPKILSLFLIKRYLIYSICKLSRSHWRRSTFQFLFVKVILFSLHSKFVRAFWKISHLNMEQKYMVKSRSTKRKLIHVQSYQNRFQPNDLKWIVRHVWLLNWKCAHYNVLPWICFDDLLVFTHKFAMNTIFIEQCVPEIVNSRFVSLFIWQSAFR